MAKITLEALDRFNEIDEQIETAQASIILLRGGRVRAINVNASVRLAAGTDLSVPDSSRIALALRDAIELAGRTKAVELLEALVLALQADRNQALQAARDEFEKLLQAAEAGSVKP